eukprot:CAMPEP_0205905646 /NCGR_PEP_ID=MMETSP1325-20131115/1468_1 /ASSEMBLY_ACC=CAM_ASM_000708 /TAXON_ID=236786 /ORGANISM="Florenciella sp., Strain RCC1007" /LENGTH=244 /DNA_ID=CAMNT_0053271571 /DNA_START=191 /DNA_END=927 /DNA_ORIENTATION=-
MAAEAPVTAVPVQEASRVETNSTFAVSGQAEVVSTRAPMDAADAVPSSPQDLKPLRVRLPSIVSAPRPHRAAAALAPPDGDRNKHQSLRRLPPNVMNNDPYHAVFVPSRIRPRFSSSDDDTTRPCRAGVASSQTPSTTRAVPCRDKCYPFITAALRATTAAARVPRHRNPFNRVSRVHWKQGVHGGFALRVLFDLLRRGESESESDEASLDTEKYEISQQEQPTEEEQRGPADGGVNLAVCLTS